MRHRSPRPFLDVLKQPSPRALRRGALAASAVVALGTATGVVLTSTQGPLSEGDVPHAQTAPTERPTPTSSTSADRSSQPSRGASRTAPAPAHRPRTTAAVPTPPLPGVGDLPSLPSSSAPAAPPAPSDPAARQTGSAPRPGRTHGSSPSPSPTPSAPSPSDDTVPQTTARTVSLVDGVWRVAMGADEAASLECSVDGGAWSTCSPTDVFVLTKAGPHSLAVRATDTSGHTDPTPAQLTVRVSGADLGLG